MENNFKNEMQKLCDMQIALWNDMRNDLTVMDNSTDEEICAIFRKHLRETHHDAVLQLVKVKIEIDKIEE
jgi:hypothetical protein